MYNNPNDFVNVMQTPAWQNQQKQNSLLSSAGWGNILQQGDYGFVRQKGNEYFVPKGEIRLGKYTTANPSDDYMRSLRGTFDPALNGWKFGYNPFQSIQGGSQVNSVGLGTQQYNKSSRMGFSDWAPVLGMAAMPFLGGALAGMAGAGEAGTAAAGGKGVMGGLSVPGSTTGASFGAGQFGAGVGGLGSTAPGLTMPSAGFGGLTMPAAGATASAGTGAMGGGGALSALKGFLGGNSMGGGLGLTNGQMLLGGADLAGRLWQSGELNDIAREAARRGSALDQPQRQAFQAQLNAYMNGEQDLTKLPLVKAAMDSVTRQTMAKASQMGTTGAGNLPVELQNNLAETFNKQGQPFLNFLSELGGYPQGPGGAGQLYGQYASQATGAPFLGIDAMAKAATFNRSNIPDWYWHANNVQQRPSLGYVA